MKAMRHALAVMLAGFAAAMVFAPLIAALCGAGLDRPALASAFNVGGRPLATSMLSAGASATVALVLGVPFAVFVERTGLRVRRTCGALALLTLMVPPYFVAEATIVLFGPAGKFSHGAALLLGFGPPGADAVARARFTVAPFVYSWPMVGVVTGGCLFPIVALSVSSALRRTDHRIFEAARLIRGRRGMVDIAARLLILPAVGSALLVFAMTLTEFSVPQLLRVHTISETIYEQIQENNIATAAALGLPLLPLVMLVGAGGATLLMQARVDSVAGLEGDIPHFGKRTGRGFAALLATTLAITPGLVVPFVSLAALSIACASDFPGLLSATRGVWDLLHEDALRTVLLGVFTATVAVLFATALARAAAGTRWNGWTVGLVAALASPAPIVGLGMIVLWNRAATIAVYQSLVIVLVTWLARFLPISLFLAQSAFSRVPREWEDAAALAGRGMFGRFFAVALPCAAPGLVAAWLATYVLCATEFSATLLVSPPGEALLAPSIVNLLRRGQDSTVAACQVFLLAVVTLPLVVIAAASMVRRSWLSRSER